MQDRKKKILHIELPLSRYNYIQVVWYFYIFFACNIILPLCVCVKFLYKSLFIAQHSRMTFLFIYTFYELNCYILIGFLSSSFSLILTIAAPAYIINCAKFGKKSKKKKIAAAAAATTQQQLLHHPYIPTYQPPETNLIFSTLFRSSLLRHPECS